MDISSGMWMALVLGGFPFFGLLLWWWNKLWYVHPLKMRQSPTGAMLPPGVMGFRFIGEMLTFLWYGGGVGMYRTHLFGSPSIITCFPAVNKYVLQSDDIFTSEWPNVDLMGPTSLVSVSGKSHTRVRSYVTNVINRPDALRRIALLVQPRIIAALESWAQKGRIKAFDEANKLSFENIGQLFISMDPGPLLDTIDNLFTGLLKGVRAQPINIPGFAYHHARQCRQTLDAIFRMELEKKNQNEVLTNDLMDGLMQIKDDEGNKLSDQEVIDNIVSLVIAGYASTSLASMWAIYFLAKYPNVLQKLRLQLHSNPLLPSFFKLQHFHSHCSVKKRPSSETAHFQENGEGCSFWVLSVIVAATVCSHCSLALTQDGLILLEMKSVLNDSRNMLSNWQDSDESPCNWTGISCHPQDQRVSAINLPYMQLGGTISPSIGKLSRLQRLALHQNSLHGFIPNEIARCAELRALYLRANYLQGGIPSDIGNLSALTILDISSNLLKGAIPSSIGRLSRLRSLNLSTNFFSGEIPDVGLLSNFGNKSFIGNLDLCGQQVHKPCRTSLGFPAVLPHAASDELAAPPKRSSHYIKGLLIGVMSTMAVALFIPLASFGLGYYRKRK
ncbi:hypothetical protein ACLB2K_049634 [Fragaria x ananassa]